MPLKSTPAPMQYLQWAQEYLDRTPARYVLASSAMETAMASDLGFEEVRLELSGGAPFGHPELRAVIGAHHGVSPERVLTCTGTSQANFLCQAALIEPGQIVLCERPVYEPVWRSLEWLGAEIRWVDRLAEKGFTPDVDAIRDGFAAGARLLCLTDLHNPSGALLDRALVREIAALAEAADGWVLIDEVYLSGVFTATEEVKSAVGVSGRVVVTASLTKTFGLGDLRAGWLAGPAWLVSRTQEIRDYLGGRGPFLADLAALRAWERLPHLLGRSRARHEENLPLVRAFAREHDLRWHEPAGGFIAWLGLPGDLDADTLEAHLRSRYDTQVTPGRFFGERGCIRLGFGIPRPDLEEGLRRLGAALTDLASPE
jgi:aspartate/methionine/tyrosine aminotransferase